MGKLFSSLQLQTFLILCIIFVANGAPYSKYGRTCKDIGCLPRETCVMQYDTCSFNQQEGQNCGRYPSCKRADPQPQQNSGPSNPNSNTNIWNLPTTTQRTTTTTTTTRPTTTTTTTTRRAWTTKSPFYNPSNPSYGGGGSYYGNRYGDDDNSFSGMFGRTTTTTRRPSSSSGSSSGGGFLSGLNSFLSGDIGKLLQDALGGRGGSSSSSGSGGGGGFGSFFDTRPISSNTRGGLFSENTSQRTQISSGNEYGGYPVTRTSSSNDYSAYPVTRDNSHIIPSAPPPNSNTASHGTYGWRNP